jgi:hypothetical protein
LLFYRIAPNSLKTEMAVNMVHDGQFRVIRMKGTFIMSNGEPVLFKKKELGPNYGLIWLASGPNVKRFAVLADSHPVPITDHELQRMGKRQVTGTGETAESMYLRCWKAVSVDDYDSTFKVTAPPGIDSLTDWLIAFGEA